MTSQRHSPFLSLLGLLCACGLELERPASARTPEPATAPQQRSEAALALAPYERFLGGVWRCVFSAGIVQHDTWSWGPGRHSLRRTTDGLAGDGTRWRTFQVVYVDPSDGRVRSFAMSPWAGGVARGELRFDGGVLEQRMEMHQTVGVRQLGLRHVFDGRDRYRATLSEHHAESETVEMAVWDYERVAAFESHPPAAQSDEPTRARLRILEPYVGRDWRDSSTSSSALASLHTRLAWMPQVEALHARVFAGVPIEPEDGAAALLDAYVYEVPGRASLSVLALASSGAVYEGRVLELGARAGELELTADASEHVEPLVLRFELEADGSLRERVWSVAGATRELLRDRRHAPGAATGP